MYQAPAFCPIVIGDLALSENRILWRFCHSKRSLQIALDMLSPRMDKTMKGWLRFWKLGPWWWSSGPCLLLRRSEFESRWRLQFFSVEFVFQKNENKQKRDRGWPIKKDCGNKLPDSNLSSSFGFSLALNFLQKISFQKIRPILLPLLIKFLPFQTTQFPNTRMRNVIHTPRYSPVQGFELTTSCLQFHPKNTRPELPPYLFNFYSFNLGSVIKIRSLIEDNRI